MKEEFVLKKTYRIDVKLNDIKHNEGRWINTVVVLKCQYNGAWEYWKSQLQSGVSR